MITMAIALAAALPTGAPHDRITTFTGRKAESLLRQCSRGAPGKGQAWYHPAASEVAAMEAAVVRHARGTGPMSTNDHVTFRDISDLRTRYAVEVAGIVRGGRRTVYGNFVPRSMAEGRHYEPTVICDGGISFFGVEYDPAADAIVRYDQNGPA